MEEVKKTGKKAANTEEAMVENTENTMTIEETFAALDALIDQKHPDAALLNYLAYDGDKVEKLLDNPKLLKTPIVRNGKQATVGYCPEVWETWS